MLLLRLLAVISLLAVVGGLLAYVFTRDRKYLNFAALVFKFTLILAFAVFGLLILERVAILPF